jgi:hypothetical protein
MTDFEWIQAARNRQPVELVNGSVVTLVSWGLPKDRSRARIKFPNGRDRTVRKSEIKNLTEIL